MNISSGGWQKCIVTCIRKGNSECVTYSEQSIDVRSSPSLQGVSKDFLNTILYVSVSVSTMVLWKVFITESQPIRFPAQQGLPQNSSHLHPTWSRLLQTANPSRTTDIKY